MATFKAEIRYKRADNTYNICIRIIHNRQIKRLSTNLYILSEDVTKSLKIKNIKILGQVEKLINDCRNICNDIGYSIFNMSCEELTKYIKKKLTEEDNFKLDFIEYYQSKLPDMKKNTANYYNIALSCLLRFLNNRHIDISEINLDFLRNFEKFIESEPCKQTKEVKTKNKRAVSAYISCIRAIHNKAKEEYNREDIGIINIPQSPFKVYKIKKQTQTKKRAISVEQIQQIIDLSYKENRVQFNLSKDCFILSFALMGMNAIDLYNCTEIKDNVIIYNRTKTADRREDNAEMRVKIESCILNLVEKYRDMSGQRVFKFYQLYKNDNSFRYSLNRGMQQISNELNADKIDFYAARHSWATIARSAKVGIDKMTVHEALNHVDNSMKVTDIYIDRDWSVLWNANKKVLDLFYWK